MNFFIIPVIIIGAWFAYSNYALMRIQNAHDPETKEGRERIQLTTDQLIQMGHPADEAAQLVAGMHYTWFQGVVMSPVSKLILMPYNYFVDVHLNGVKY